MQRKKFYAKKENLCKERKSMQRKAESYTKKSGVLYKEKRSPMKNLRSYVASPSLRLQNRRHILAVLPFLLSAMP